MSHTGHMLTSVYFHRGARAGMVGRNVKIVTLLRLDNVTDTNEATAQEIQPLPPPYRAPYLTQYPRCRYRVQLHISNRGRRACKLSAAETH